MLRSDNREKRYSGVRFCALCIVTAFKVINRFCIKKNKTIKTDEKGKKHPSYSRRRSMTGGCLFLRKCRRRNNFFVTAAVLETKNPVDIATTKTKPFVVIRGASTNKSTRVKKWELFMWNEIFLKLSSSESFAFAVYRSFSTMERLSPATA